MIQKIVLFLIVLLFNEVKATGLEDFKATLNPEIPIEVEGYYYQYIKGFTVYIEKKCITKDNLLTGEALYILKTKLEEILSLHISTEKKAILQQTPIFLDWNTDIGIARYHSSKKWLEINHFPSVKYQSIEISNLSAFVQRSYQNQKYVILHELAHALHDKAFHYKNNSIHHAYTFAKRHRLYTDVSYQHYNGMYQSHVEAYGMKNEREFFAELTEAYFGTNDYFPFNRNEIERHDPVAFNMLQQIWGDSSSTVAVATVVDLRKN